MTLGAFTGYFRNRNSTKNTLYPYSSYSGHLVLGVIYSQVTDSLNEKHVFNLDELHKIKSVIKDFKFFAQPKYRIASATPGSGNTKNIGSINNEEALLNGKGIFAELGKKYMMIIGCIFLTKDMAAALEIQRPYTNLKTYLEYKQRGVNVLTEHEEQIKNLPEDQIDEIATEE